MGVGPWLRELLRTPFSRTSENSPSETVWKIAEGLSSVLRRRQKAADRGSFDPYRPPSGPLFSETSRFSKQFRKVYSAKFRCRILQRGPSRGARGWLPRRPTPRGGIPHVVVVHKDPRMRIVPLSFRCSDFAE